MNGMENHNITRCVGLLHGFLFIYNFGMILFFEYLNGDHFKSNKF